MFACSDAFEFKKLEQVKFFREQYCKINNNKIYIWSGGARGSNSDVNSRVEDNDDNSNSRVEDNDNDDLSEDEGSFDSCGRILSRWNLGLPWVSI
jgi:hypothetical protein